MPFKDKETAKQYYKNYNLAHKEQRRIRDAARKEQRRAYANEYRKLHPKYDIKGHEIRKTKRASMLPLVYAWFDSTGIAEWVGRGTLERAKSHKSRKWWTPEHLLLTMTCKNEWQAMEYEGIWGQRYQPRYNIEGYRHGGR